jgi:hypothetical protein
MVPVPTSKASHHTTVVLIITVLKHRPLERRGITVIMNANMNRTATLPPDPDVQNLRGAENGLMVRSPAGCG